MKRKNLYNFLIVFGLVLALLGGIAAALRVQAQGTGPYDPLSPQADLLGSSFTYQGRLIDNDTPVDGVTCTLTFDLYEAASGGSPLDMYSDTAPVNDGYFTVELDFGDAFNKGEARWLEVSVQCPGDSAPVPLDDRRVALTAAPYALYALGAPWSGLSSVPAGFADGVDDVSAVVSGTNVFAGDGLTQVSAGNAVTIAADFGGNGSATTVARSDHDHDTIYSLLGHTHPGSDITSAVPTATLALSATQAPWSGLVGVPTDLSDGDDDTTYTVGAGLNLSGTEFSITPTYRLPQTCANGQIAEWNDTTSLWECGDDDTGGGGSYWSLTGNASTDPSTNFLGTTDNVSLTLAVSGTAALRIEPVGDAFVAPNLIGGYSGNSVAGSATGATIAGGGSLWNPNIVSDTAGTVGGGRGNTAGGQSATIGGGSYNKAEGQDATVGGGQSNTASSDFATVGGGAGNTASGNDATIGGGSSNIASDYAATVGGGQDNTASASYATIGGGEYVSVTGVAATVAGGSHITVTGDYAAVGGGERNLVTATHATVGGGLDNSASGGYATIGGGETNEATTWYATVGGGNENTASSDYATVGGGGYNDASDDSASVSGGWSNTASGWRSAVGGGSFNKASGDAAVVAGGGYWDFGTEGNEASGAGSAIGGGWSNRAVMTGTTIAGGANNVISDTYGAIGGGESNLVTATHATIAGGYNITVTGDYAAVGGGSGNTANGYIATVGGGSGNTASGYIATIGGGSGNIANGNRATIGGGAWNTASGYYATIGGGDNNNTSNWYTSVGGGYNNTASQNYATVGGGYNNTASGTVATVGGGESNLVTATHATIAGGYNITVTGDYAAVGGGYENVVGGVGAFVGGGGYDGSTTAGNQALAPASTIGGGYGNLITPTASYATVPGGANNAAQGNYSFAAGHQATAAHSGSFVWSDSWGTGATSQYSDQFLVQAYNGSRFEDGSGVNLWVDLAHWSSKPISTSTGAYLSSGGTWTNSSDRNKKENFKPVDGQQVLEQLVDLPITTWNYKAEDPSVRHLGPMAQDFYAAFELGDSNTSIGTLDADGVALAAIQALQAENAELRDRVDDLEARLSALEEQVNGEAASSPTSSRLLPSGWAGLLALAAVAGVWVWRRE